MKNTILDKIYTFPIKGFPGLKLETTQLTKGDGIPDDRRYAVTRGVAHTGDWMPARSYYINAYVDEMMKFSLRKTGDHKFEIGNPAGETLEIVGDNPESLTIANQSMSKFVEHAGVEYELPAPKIIERNTQGNWDYPDTPISIINLETVRTISRGLGVDMDPARYRGNLILDGIPAWQEFQMMGKRLLVGTAELEVMRPIARCPTPGVNPETAERDISFQDVFPEKFGHAYCGMYAVVSKTGNISVSSPVEIIGDAEMSLETASCEAEDYRLWPRILEITDCQISEDSTRMSLKGLGQWPIPDAKPGQRLRFLMGADNWTSEYIAKTTPGQYHIEINRSATDDPATEHLRKAYTKGDQLIVCGPFGRA